VETGRGGAEREGDFLAEYHGAGVAAGDVDEDTGAEAVAGECGRVVEKGGLLVCAVVVEF
jgi:hypothetical protein